KTMILSVFITVISGHDKPQPSGCLLGGNYSFEDQVAITNLDSLLEGVDPLSDIGDIESEYDG
ncbi:hypothetical protein MZE61_22725, partial [Escherichia coli]|nr:hypothetical protein [Escherichia coli]